MKTRPFPFVITFILILAAFSPAGAQVTQVQINDNVLVADVDRLGMHMSGNNYYDSPTLKVRVEENFEGTIYRQIHDVNVINSTTVESTSDMAQDWVDCMQGSTYTILSGPDTWKTGQVVSLTLNGTKPRFVLDSAFTPDGTRNGIMIDRPRLDEGSLSQGPRSWYDRASFAHNGLVSDHNQYEHTDLRPGSFGNTCLNLRGSVAAAQAGFPALYKDVGQTTGPWRIKAWVKGKSASSSLSVEMSGISGTTRSIPLSTTSWTQVNEFYNLTGTEQDVTVVFRASGGDVLIDDIEIAMENDTNPTAFRDDFIDVITLFNPGCMRLLKNGGNEIENLIRPPMTAYASRGVPYGSIRRHDIGLHDFIDMCAYIGADPWLVIPGTLHREDIDFLMEYLGGPTNTAGGTLRAELGRVDPWLPEFNRVHVQFGNEVVTFPNSGYNGPDYWEQLIDRGKSSTYYDPKVLFTLNEQPTAWVLFIQSQIPNMDRLCIGNYNIFSLTQSEVSTYLNTDEKLFKYVYAAPWYKWTEDELDSQYTGLNLAKANNVEVSIYEGGNFHTTFGDAPSAIRDRFITSIGGQVSMVNSELLLLKLHGVRSQNQFSFSQFSFTGSGSFGDGITVRLWGQITNMRPEDRRLRPGFLAAMVCNNVMAGDLIETVHSGDVPTFSSTGLFDWGFGNQNPSPRTVDDVPVLHSYAFKDGDDYGLIVVNTDVAQSRTIQIDLGTGVEGGTALSWVLDAPSIIANNEPEQPTPQVNVVTSVVQIAQGAQIVIPPHTIQTFRWGGEPTPIQPTPASNPSPANGAVGQDVYTTLSWTPGLLATSHDVYFGTDPNPGAAQFRGNQAGSTFDPGLLHFLQTYHWRVDTHSPSGLLQGAVWDFTVEGPPSPPAGGIALEDSEGAVTGSGSSASMAASNGGGPANYLVVGAISETLEITGVTYDGQPMGLLKLENSTHGKVAVYGLATTDGSGNIVVSYSGTTFGAQPVAYAYLSGVDTASPLRTVAGVSQNTGTGAINLTYPVAAQDGDFAFFAAYQNNNYAISVTPADAELVNAYAPASFTGCIAYDADLPDGAYATGFTFANGTQREVAAGVILAGAEGDPTADTDGDGIPDWYEVLYSGSSTGLVATLDDDGDGPDNFAEWIAFTDPTNSTSVFRIDESLVEPMNGRVVLEWLSVPGRDYIVTRQDDPMQSQQMLATDLPATPPVNTFTATVSGAEQSGVYGVGVGVPTP